jgi:hypothetical protein
MLWVGRSAGVVGAPCVTWVLDEREVVGDNNRDRVSPPCVGGRAVASVFVGRPARVLAGTPVAGADRG